MDTLGDDCLHKLLTFVPLKDCARGAGAASKHLRDLATSTTLARARGADSYALRRPEPSGRGVTGVVHALATALGTRQWPTRIVRSSHQNSAQVVANAAVPPAGLVITIHREGLMELRFDPDTEPYASFLKSAIVDQNVARKISG
ncbi:unnamed protein product, partial [Pelagomonas calceolata]